MKKEFKYVPPAGAADETPGEDGLTESAIDFNWERDVESKVRRDCMEKWKRETLIRRRDDVCRCSKLTGRRTART